MCVCVREKYSSLVSQTRLLSFLSSVLLTLVGREARCFPGLCQQVSIALQIAADLDGAITPQEELVTLGMPDG